MFYDYDKCEYILQRTEDSADILKFGFSCMCFEQIMNAGGREMLDQLYKDVQLDKSQWIDRANITLKIDCSNVLKT